MNKHRDSFYADHNPPTFEEAWEYFKDCIRPGNVGEIMEQGPNNYVINENLLNTLVGYLTNQPYRQVAGLLGELSKLEPLNPPTKLTLPPTKEPVVKIEKSKSQEKREAIQTAAKKS